MSSQGSKGSSDMPASQPAGVLRIGVHYEPSGVDPHINAAELGLQMTMGVLDTLVFKTPHGQYLPYLAQSWDISPDERDYTFRLRRDVAFHDGEPMDAAAVKFSLDRARDPQNKSQLAGSMLGPYEHATVIDDYTLRVHLSEPFAMFLDSLSQGWLAPVSPAAARKMGPDFRFHPVGTGPFIFDAWEQKREIRLRRNPHYRWGPPAVTNSGPAHLEEIVFVFLPEDGDRVQALLDGDTQGIFYVPPPAIASLRENPEIEIQVWPIRGAPVCMMMNTAQSPTDEYAVRRAISHLIDQDALVHDVFHGEFPPARGPLSQETLGYNPEVARMYPCEPDLARKLLDEAGWRPSQTGVREKNGQTLRVIFYALPVNYYPRFGQIVNQALAGAGFEVEVREVHPVEWVQAGFAGKHHLIPQGKYASAPHILSYIYHSRYSQGGYGWTKRSPEYRPDLDELLERGERALNAEEYVPLYQQAQRIIMEEALVVPLHCNTNVVALKKGIAGLRFDAIGAYPYLHDVAIDAQ